MKRNEIVNQRNKKGGYFKIVIFYYRFHETGRGRTSESPLCEQKQKSSYIHVPWMCCYKTQVKFHDIENVGWAGVWKAPWQKPFHPLSHIKPIVAKNLHKNCAKTPNHFLQVKATHYTTILHMCKLHFLHYTIIYQAYLQKERSACCCATIAILYIKYYHTTTNI